MRNPALGLGLALALFGGTPSAGLAAAPCIISIFVQNMLGAWSGVLWGWYPPKVSHDGPRGEGSVLNLGVWGKS